MEMCGSISQPKQSTEEINVLPTNTLRNSVRMLRCLTVYKVYHLEESAFLETYNDVILFINSNGKLELREITTRQSFHLKTENSIITAKMGTSEECKI